MSWTDVRNLLFAFDAEFIHERTIEAVSDLASFPGGALLLRELSAVGRGTLPRAHDPIETLGILFAHRIGLAAGFDKNARLLEALPALGFAFAEVGTVTPLPQLGNPRPRLFREPGNLALFNRMGFNNQGAEAVARRVARAKKRLPASFRVGINVGKGKDTPLEQAASDYVQALRPFQGLVDYAVINVSSPNTPGLRSLQAPATLQKIVAEAKAEIARWPKPIPLLLKLAPELGEWAPEARAELVLLTEREGISGWVLTNTLGGEYQGQSGGWSGQPVRAAALSLLKEFRSLTRLPIVGVGGVMNVEDAQTRLRAGAELLQLYTGWIYGGPTFPARLAQSTSVKTKEP